MSLGLALGIFIVVVFYGGIALLIGLALEVGSRVLLQPKPPTYVVVINQEHGGRYGR
jgi:hypothetical protein